MYISCKKGMMKALKKNQIVIFAIALMLITAGYLNYTMQTEQTAQTSGTINNEEMAGIGDAKLVSTDLNNAIPQNNVEQKNDVANTTNSTVNADNKSKTENSVNQSSDVKNQTNTTKETTTTSAKETTDTEKYFAESKLERENMYSEMLESYQSILASTNVSAEQKSTGETVARECARGIAASKSGGGPSREPSAGVTCGLDGGARRKLSGGSETTGDARVGCGVTDDTEVDGALSNGRVKRESDGSTPGNFVHSNASHGQLRPPPFACLTEREYEVARLVAEGLDNREIAATAYLSEGTVRNNISSILSKMSLKNRTQIAVAYYKSKGSTR